MNDPETQEARIYGGGNVMVRGYYRVDMLFAGGLSEIFVVLIMRANV